MGIDGSQARVSQGGRNARALSSARNASTHCGLQLVRGNHGRAYQRHFSRSFYNEIIVDGPHMTANLPYTISAFMGSSSAHAKFLREHDLTDSEVPLVTLTLNGGNSPVH